MSKRLITILAVLTLLAYAWPAWTRFSTSPRAPVSFSSPPHLEPTLNQKPFMDQSFINPDTGSNMVHVGSICEMPNGALGAVWYGGTREGAKDVAIFFSQKYPGMNTQWSTPRIIVDRISATRELNRYIRKVGNPILFRGPGKQICLIYVTITLGGWSGSSLNLKTSRDGGFTWNASRRLTLSPFFNISELVKGRPLSINMTGIHGDRHDFAVPIYHEFLGYFPEILWITFFQHRQEFIYEKSRMTGGSSFIQPSIAPLNAQSATAFYRCRSKAKHIAMARTDDGGQSWSSPHFLQLPNPDSAVDALPLSEGRILLAFNDSQNSRETLKLAVSKNAGRNWIRIFTLENSPDQEFSYPYMIRDQSGLIHLVYTWKRERIKHVVLNEAWVDQKFKEIFGK